MQETVYFRGEMGLLEGIVHWPSGESGQKTAPTGIVVVCHPHSLHGGEMDNNVVVAVAESVSRMGLLALRFNFRGVGRSDGAYADGIGEQGDVTTAVGYAQSLALQCAERVAVVGYSFGAFVGLSAGCSDDRVSALVGIAPPLKMYDFGFLTECRKPKLLLTGDKDSFSSPGRFNTLVASILEPKAGLIVKGMDHFWWGREDLATEPIGRFLEPIMRSCDVASDSKAEGHML